jgi:arylsulfatase
VRKVSRILVLLLFVEVGAPAQADQGPRHHAEGTFDVATSIYTVVKGDDLDAIAERFGVTVKELMKVNQLSSTEIEVGQPLVITAPVQTTGKPGTPSATTTLPGNQLPAPAPKFGGVIKEDVKDSTAWWPPRIVPPKGAPNVLLVQIDDSGFATSSTFGGVIPSPTLDKLAANGLRYTQMHNAALCSPTRAGTISGRNHHTMGFGVIAEVSTGFPGYDAIITEDRATIGRILQDNGYATSWFGKDHNTPTWVATEVGPFDQWPSGYGFEYFYGFPVGETDQWTPYLFRNHTAIFPWRGKPPGTWNLTTAMADEAIDWLRRIDATHPDKPFLLYYAPGGTHSPHQPTKEWIDKISKLHLFDEGWNKLRETIFANQKKLGVIPPDAKLTPWPKGPPASLKEWDELTADDKKMFIKQVEVFAAYHAYTDHEAGRVIDEIERQGKLDNTLVIYLQGDNGNSAEGTTIGTPNDLAAYNGVDVPVKDQLAHFYDLWGGPETAPHMAVAWTWAFDTPYKWMKQVASYLGGNRSGMVISWPARIKDKGGIRNQFHHVIDVVPTILEAAGIPAPEYVDGIKQKPIEGVSMVYTFDADPNVPSRHKTQYFEMIGERAIYHEGWYANTKVAIAPWNNNPGVKLPDPLDYEWELYDLRKDWTQYTDVSKKYPEKLKEMQKLFVKEAWKYNVFPLNNEGFQRILQPRPSGSPGMTEFSYNAPISIALGAMPPYVARDFTITADIDIPKGGGEGMLITEGGRFDGWGLYLLKGKPVFTYNLLDLERFRWEGKQAIAPGRHTVVFDFKYDGPGLAKGGTGVLSVDGEVVAKQTIPHTVPALEAVDEWLDVGYDTRTGVDERDYQVPFTFTGTINKITFKPGPPEMTEEQMKEAAKLAAKPND